MPRSKRCPSNFAQVRLLPIGFIFLMLAMSLRVAQEASASQTWTAPAL